MKKRWVIAGALVLCALIGTAVTLYLRREPAGETAPTRPAPPRDSYEALIIGSWKQIEQDGIPTPQHIERMFQFYADGTFRLISRHLAIDKDGGNVGTYRIDGKYIHLASPDSYEKNWTLEITHLDSHKLSIIRRYPLDSPALPQIPTILLRSESQVLC